MSKNDNAGAANPIFDMDLKYFIGTKIIRAVELSLHDYLTQVKGQAAPDQDDQAGYAVTYPDGYVSWSPFKAFDEAYRQILEGCMSFGLAIEAIKKGLMVAHIGWENTFLFLLPAGEIPVAAIHDPALKKVIQKEIDSETFDALPSIRMWTADKKMLTGWAPSQPEMLSDQYYIVGDINSPLNAEKVESDKPDEVERYDHRGESMVGKGVVFYPEESDAEALSNGNERMNGVAAIITRDWGGSIMNLVVFPDQGNPIFKSSVLHQQSSGMDCEFWDLVSD